MSSYRSNLWKMYLFVFLSQFHFIAGVLVPFYLEWGKISFTQIMILQSFFVGSIFLLEVPTGAIADRFGRKVSLIIAALLTGIAALIYSSYPHFYIFILGEFLWAAGSAFISGAEEAIVYDSLKKVKEEKKSKAIFGKVSNWGMAALMISAPLGSIIASSFGLRYTMMLIAIPMFMAAIIAFWMKEPQIKRQKKKSYWSNAISGMKYFKKHKILKILAFDSISIASLTFFIIWTYQVLLKQLNVSIAYFGFVLAGMMVAQMAVMSRFNWLEKIFGSKKRYLLWSALITGMGFVLLGINTYISIAIFLVMLISAFGLTRKTLFQSYFNKYIQSHHRATVLSTISMVSRLVMAALYLIVGLLVDWSLNYALIIIGVAIILLALISRVEEKHLKD